MSKFKGNEHYDVLAPIGQGGFGEVWLCKSKASNELKALKRVRCKNQKEVNNAMKEVFILKSFDHENVVKYESISFESNENADDSDLFKYSICFSMNYFKEGDLEHFIKERFDTQVPFSQSRIHAYMKQLSAGVKYIHNKGVIHRDLKPANVFMTNNYQKVVIGDFGLIKEKVIGDKTTLEKSGTPFYMPPEAFTTNKAANAATDIWSLGCIFYELLTLDNSKPLYLEIFKDKGFWPRLKRKILRHYHYIYFDLLQAMLAEDPRKRISASDLHSHLILKTPRYNYASGEVPFDKKKEVEETEKLLKIDRSEEPTLPKEVKGDLKIKDEPIKKIEIHETEGDSSVKMEVGLRKRKDGEKVPHFYVFQGGYKKNLSLFLWVLDITLKNTENKERTVEFECEYKDKEGDWIPCDQTMVDVCYYNTAIVPHQDMSAQASSTIRLKENECKKVLIRSMLKLEAEVGSDNYRRTLIPECVPNPLKMKIIMSDTRDEQQEVIVEKSQELAPLLTLDTWEKRNYNKYKVLKFVEADDTINRVQSYCVIYMLKSTTTDPVLNIELNFRGSRRVLAYKLETFRTKSKYANEKFDKEEDFNGEMEVCITKRKVGEKEYFGRIVLLSTKKTENVEAGLVYGLKIEMNSPTGSIVDYFHIPYNELRNTYIKDSVLKLDNEIFEKVDKTEFTNIPLSELAYLSTKTTEEDDDEEKPTEEEKDEENISFSSLFPPEVKGAIVCQKEKIIKPNVKYKPIGNSDVSINFKYAYDKQLKTKTVNFSVVHDRFQPKPGFIRFYLKLYEIKLKNPTDQPISIQCFMEYADKDGNWIDCIGCKVNKCNVDRFGHYDLAFDKLSSNIITLEPNSINTEYGICARFPMVEGNPTHEFNRQRIPNQLPTPLRIRLTIKDTFGKQKQVIAEIMKKPIPLPTIESYKKRYFREAPEEGSVALFVEDVIKKRRVFSGFFYNEKRKQYWFTGDSRYLYIGLKYLKNQIALARKYKRKEIELKEFARTQSYGAGYKCFALFSEKHNYQVYAIKLKLFSETGSLVQYFQIDYDKIE